MSSFDFFFSLFSLAINAFQADWMRLRLSCEKGKVDESLVFASYKVESRKSHNNMKVVSALRAPITITMVAIIWLFWY